MNESAIARYRRQLEQTLVELDVQDQLGRDSQKTVTLDQQSVGRLSRMDALQQQAMAKATAQRRETLRLRIHATLDRMNEGEFSYCTQCGEEIPPKRLDLDPTVPNCVSCATS